MADRYISREWLEKALNDYRDKRCWNTEELDVETIGRVLDVMENVIKRAPEIGPRKLCSKKLDAMEAALWAQKRFLGEQIEESEKDCRIYESTGNALLTAFYKGMLQAQKEEMEFLERMTRHG